MLKRDDIVYKNIKKYINLLRKNFDISAVALFGSYANGKPNEYSDIDIAVYSDNFGVNPIEETTQLLKMRRKINTDIEPIPFNSSKLRIKDKTDFSYEILNKGKLIFNNGKFLI